MFDRLKGLLNNSPGTADPAADALPETRGAVGGQAAEFERAADLFGRGQFDAAADLLARLLEAQHDFADAHFLLGLIEKKRGDLEAAADGFVLATAFKPDFADAWCQLAAVEMARSEDAGGRRAIARALEGDPAHAEANAMAARLCETDKKFGRAIEHWQAVVRAQPDHALAYCNLGRLTLRDTQDDEQALRYVRTALSLQPRLAEAHSCLAQLLQFQGKSEDAIRECDTALEINPAATHPRMIRALALLSLGRYEPGWEDYEERKRVYPLFAVRKFPYPEWAGGDLAGQRLLVFHEQGLGDEIMFASCFRDVLRDAPQCVIECSAKLAPLFRRSFQNATIAVGDQTNPDLTYLQSQPAIDCQVAAGSLPRIYRRNLSDFPSEAGYLQADAAATQCWKERLRNTSTGDRPSIGLSWRGGVQSTNQATRSVAPDALKLLVASPRINFVSLQYGDRTADLAVLNAGSYARVHDWLEAQATFDETAALVSALDLIITVDTTVAHLAGALGKPVWVMVPHNAEWRYLREGTAMPWYPTMRIFRRRHGADWSDTVMEIAQALELWQAGFRKVD